MELRLLVITIIGSMVLLTGCVNNAEQLGQHMVKVRNAQVYNPDATTENLGLIPEGSGERMEGAYQVYTGKQDKDLQGTDSQFLEGFSN
ncbi:hypothetical protein VISI1226_15771 [Vibrio sinaloensis DSM 21326]|uniref:Lipoprotein n=1 Tax=Vibrio sinaloensis DSM 21326 TaxID=945550 RepID=E8MD37_PHOS4|nr:hypothetical protein [Vibrio sinaloensis]EGA68213.1 hypothetical protein VISI1226_15771 [Vibrio sinaloensis DSM 21326]MDN3683803.1 hypothetical protein [Vibrio sinaloensis]